MPKEIAKCSAQSLYQEPPYQHAAEVYPVSLVFLPEGASKAVMQVKSRPGSLALQKGRTGLNGSTITLITSSYWRHFPHPATPKSPCTYASETLLHPVL